MPGGGLHAIQAIRSKSAGPEDRRADGVQANDDVALRSMPGRRGYVLKGVGSRMLAEILQTVAGGETYVSPALAARTLVSLS